MKTLAILSISDFKLVFRDASLRFFLFIPIFILLFVNPFLPYLIRVYPASEPFLPYLLMGSLIQVSVMFGFIYSTVFIDEKDLQVSKVYGVLPISRRRYILSRLMIPFILAIMFNLVLLFWVQPFYRIDLLQGFATSIMASCIMLIIALSVAILSDNKMEGMTYFKLINTLTILPLLAFFAPKLYWLFALIPTHWLFQSIELLIEYQSAWVMLLIGLTYCSVWIFVLVRIFARKHFQ